MTTAFDLRPHVTFYTPSGAVIVAVDPATFLGGSVLIPGLGAVPYDINIFPFQMVLHLPAYGDVPISLSPSGGGSSTTVTIPGIGTVPYAVTIGPPDIPLEQQANAVQAYLGAGMATVLPMLLIGGAAWLLLRRR
jgi:hypothetical protein